jgi:ABC-2 type transport system ATP-binding protein
MQEVERLCDNILMMKAGRIVDTGSPGDLIARYGRSNLEDVFLDVARGRRSGRGTAQGVSEPADV